MGAWVIVIMFALILVGVPITYALGIASLGFFITSGLPLDTFAQKLAVSVDNFTLISLPFFIIAGNVMNHGGITRRLFAFFNELCGHIKGGLNYVTVFTSLIFSAMSGSALANAAGMGTLQIKAMEEQKYDKDFAACLVTTAAVLGPIIPPSVIMIVYAVTAGTSIQKMFMGGMIPGLLFAIMLLVMCRLYGRKFNFPQGEKTNFKRLWATFKDAFWAILAPVIILWGIFSGVFTATESGAIATIYSILVSMLIYKDLTLKDIKKVLLDSAKTTGGILFISATATVLGFCLSIDQLPLKLANYLAGAISNKYILLLILTVVYLFLGCIMDGSAIVITTVPIFAPFCKLMGIDLVYLGVLVGILMSVGTITPPVGIAMFVVSKNTGIPIERFTRIMLPWYLLIIAFLLILIFIPQIVTILPQLIYGSTM